MADVLSLRFYGAYFNMKLISETQNLNGLGDSIMSLVHTSDYVVTVIYTLLSALYLSNIRKQKQYELKKCLVSLCVALVAFILPYVHERLNLFSTFEEQTARYNYDYCFERPHYGIACGILKTAFADLMYLDATRPTTKQDKELMASYARTSYPLYDQIGKKNIIVIVIESLLSDVLKREGDKCVMPHLKQLADSSYYNPNMVSTAGPGYSSDGQLMLMTGIMGHRAYVTVSHFTNNSFPGLGHIAKQRNMTMALIEPTEENYWHQKDLCPEYGIDSLYYFDEWTTDENVFQRAIEVTECLKERPFFLSVLTISMHMPYKKQFEQALGELDDNEATTDYLNYLSRCQYTDYHLGRFLDYLRKERILDNTLLFVISDHCVPLGELKYASNGLTPMLPVIIHGLPSHIQPSTSTTIYQQDLYPTLLDILATKHPDYPQWQGVGYSIFSDTPQEERWSQIRQQEFSEMLLETNFTKNADDNI